MTDRHLLVDFGKVVSHPQAAHHLERLGDLSGLQRAVFEERYWAHRAAYDAGQPAAGFWSDVLGRTVDDGDPLLAALVAADVESWTVLNDDTLDVLRRARAAGARLALLSNAPHEIAAAIDGRREMVVFDRLFFSARLGLTKPALAIFSAVLDELGCAASQVTFVDDLPENVAGARAAGLRALLFTSAADLAQQLAL